MRLLLDTTTFIYAVQFPERLSRRVSSMLQDLDNDLELSAISITEIAIKSASGKLAFSAATLRKSTEDLGIRMLPYSADHAFSLFELPVHRRDPFDRQIIAQALSEQIPIVTTDEKFRLYKELRIIW